MNKNGLFGDAWSLIDQIADTETKERFELDDILYELSMKIFDYRIKNGWTQTQLAEKLCITQAMVSKLESGEYNPTVEQLWKISHALGWKFTININDSIEPKYVLPNSISTGFAQTSSPVYEYQRNESFGYSKEFEIKEPVIIPAA